MDGGMDRGQALGRLTENGKKNLGFHLLIRNVLHNQEKSSRKKGEGTTPPHLPLYLRHLCCVGWLPEWPPEDWPWKVKRSVLLKQFLFFLSSLSDSCSTSCHMHLVCLCPARQHSATCMQHHLSYCNQMELVRTKPKQALPRNKGVEKDLSPAVDIISKAVPS